MPVFASRHPFLILPRVIQIPNDRRGLRRDFVIKTKWIGLIHFVAVKSGNDVVLIVGAMPHAGHKGFPNPGPAARLEWITMLIPVIEIAHQEHLPRAWRPDGELRSPHAFFNMRMSAQLPVKANMTAFVEKIEILLGE